MNSQVWGSNHADWLKRFLELLFFANFSTATHTKCIAAACGAVLHKGVQTQLKSRAVPLSVCAIHYATLYHSVRTTWVQDKDQLNGWIKPCMTLVNSSEDFLLFPLWREEEWKAPAVQCLIFLLQPDRLEQFQLNSWSAVPRQVTQKHEKLILDVCTVPRKAVLKAGSGLRMCVSTRVCVSSSFDWRERRPPLSTCMACLEKDLCPHYAPTGSFLIKRCLTEGWQNGPDIHYVSGCGADSCSDWRQRLWTDEGLDELCDHWGCFYTE